MSRFSHLELGNREGASRETIRATNDGDRCLREAASAYESRRFEQALRLYSKTLEHSPANPAAWAGQGQALIELGEFDEARLWTDKALEKFPNDATLLAVKAVALARGGDLPAALVYSDCAVEAEDRLPYVWLSRGDVLLARREKRAAYCFDRAVSLASGDWLVQWIACRIHCFYDQFASALRYALKALELNGASASVWFELGRCQRELGLAAVAQQSLEQARQLDPGCAAEIQALALQRPVPAWRRWTARWRSRPRP